jgi:hypothetical protein
VSLGATTNCCGGTVFIDCNGDPTDPATSCWYACGPAGSCIAVGAGSCNQNAECCSGLCNDGLGLGACTCLAVGSACGESVGCCSGACLNGSCACAAAGLPCLTGEDCCSGTCSGGTCA